MERLRCGVRKLLKPDLARLLLLCAVSAAGLTIVFSCGFESAAMSGVIYAVSAYTTTATAVRFVAVSKRCRRRVLANRHVQRYRNDLDFKLRLRLGASFSVNLFYSVYRAALGILLGSAWFGATAAYYLVLSCARFLLLRDAAGGNGSSEYKKCRFCGWMLAVLTVPIIAIDASAVYGGNALVYPGHLIYAAAAYTFYSLTLAIVNICRNRSVRSPVYSAANALTLTTALVSMFFLQGAMFHAFGDGADWERSMNLIFAVVVIVLVTSMSLYLITDSARKISKLKDPDA